MFGVTVPKETGALEGTNNYNAVEKTKYAAVSETGNSAWKKTCSVMEGITRLVGTGNVAHCVEAAGEDDMYVDRKSDVITENNGLKENDATIKTGDNVEDRVDSTLETSKEFPGVDNALKNLEAALGSFHDAAFNTWDDVRARADTMLENSKDFPGDSSFDASTVNLDDTVGEILEVPTDDVLGSGPDNTKFVIKGGLSVIADSINDAKANSKSASEKLESSNNSTWNKTKTFTVDAANNTADAIETGYDTVIDGAGTAWVSTINFLENAWGGTKRKSIDLCGTSLQTIQDDVDLMNNKTSSAWENITNFVADIGKDNGNKSDEDRCDTFATVGPVRSVAQRNNDSETAATGDMLKDMVI